MFLVLLKTSLIPVKDSVFDLWQSFLYTRVQANLALWLIPVAIFNTLTPYKTEWDAAYLICKDKSTRSKSDVARKNAARKAYVTALRAFIAGCLNYNPLISNEMRTEIGLPIHDKTHSAAPIPADVPMVEVVPGRGNIVTVNYIIATGDEGSHSRRKKPPHVHHMDFCYKVGSPAPVTPTDCNNTLVISKVPYKIFFTSNDTGKTLYYFARWVNTRNQPGPWTNVASMIIP